MGEEILSRSTVQKRAEKLRVGSTYVVAGFSRVRLQQDRTRAEARDLHRYCTIAEFSAAS
jgi:hypothetical protein